MTNQEILSKAKARFMAAHEKQYGVRPDDAKLVWWDCSDSKTRPCVGTDSSWEDWAVKITILPSGKLEWKLVLDEWEDSENPRFPSLPKLMERISKV